MIVGKTFSRRRIAIEALVLGLIVAAGVGLEWVVSADVLHTIIRAIVITIVPAPTLFAIYYARGPWRSTEVGRSLMALIATIAIFLWFVMVVWVFGEFHGLNTVRIVLYSLLWYALWRLFLTLRHSQMRASARERQLARSGR